MFAEGFHGNRVNCDASRQRQRLYYCRGPFVFSLNVSEQLHFLIDTLSLSNSLFRFLFWFGLFFFFWLSICHGCAEKVRWAARITMKMWWGVVFFVWLVFFYIESLECHGSNWFISLLVIMMQLEMEEQGMKEKISSYSTPTSTGPNSRVLLSLG